MPKCPTCSLDIEGANKNLEEAVRLAWRKALETAAVLLEGRGLLVEAESVRAIKALGSVPAEKA